MQSTYAMQKNLMKQLDILIENKSLRESQEHDKDTSVLNVQSVNDDYNLKSLDMTDQDIPPRNQVIKILLIFRVVLLLCSSKVINLQTGLYA